MAHARSAPSGHARRVAAPALAAVFAAACAAAPPAAGRDAAAAATAPAATYRVYVGAESADLLHLVRFGPDGAAVERTTPVGEMAVETEGPHGFVLAPDGRFVYMTTGHGIPAGKLWKLAAGPDTPVAEPVPLGSFPSTLDVTPDGLFAFVANFNLHGEPVPSSVSVVYTPDMTEVERVETCTMPHGMRVAPGGLFAYSACMMDDQLVEIDTSTFEVARRHRFASGCSPTWAEPSVDGRFVYVACNGSDAVHEIDRSAWKVTRTFQAGRGPYNLEATPDGRLLLATLKGGAAVQFFELASGRSLAVTPSSTTLPHGVVSSPDSRYAFASAEGVGAQPGKLDVFDLASFERVADVDVGQQAGGIAFWRMEGA